MKLKYLLSIVLVFALCFGVLNLAFADKAAEVPEGYTPIYTAEDLNNIRNNLDKKYILMNDIDLSVYENWEPIGSLKTSFTGEFDGNGYSVSNLNINKSYNDSNTAYFGLFGYVQDCTIKNISIEKAKISVSYSGASGTNCRVGIVAGYGYFAKLVGCAVSGKIIVEGFPVIEAGGLVGRCAWDGPTLCTNYADIEISANSNTTDVTVGGITGISEYLTEKECANFGDISVKGTDIKTYSYIEIGGIDGNSVESCTIIDSYNRGDLSVDFSNSRTYIGGISGQPNVIKNVYNTGRIEYPEDFRAYAGAISGNFFFSALAAEAGASIVNAYYINEGMIPSYYEGYNIEDFTKEPFSNVKLLAEEEFKNQDSFVGFDFDTTWEIEENGYPILNNQPEVSEEPTTEPDTESTTEPSTESSSESADSSTEPSSEPSDDECLLANLWIVKTINWLFNILNKVVICIVNLMF